MPSEDRHPERSVFIIVFDRPETAEYVHTVLLDMEKADMLTVKTASTVTRNKRGKLEVRNREGLNRWTGAVGGVAVGVLLGGPILGGAIGAIAGSRGKGEQRKAKKFLDEKMGPDESALILVIESADWAALNNMLARYDAQIMKMSLAEQAERELIELTGNPDIVASIQEEIDLQLGETDQS